MRLERLSCKVPAHHHIVDRISGKVDAEELPQSDRLGVGIEQHAPGQNEAELHEAVTQDDRRDPGADPGQVLHDCTGPDPVKEPGKEC